MLIFGCISVLLLLEKEHLLHGNKLIKLLLTVSENWHYTPYLSSTVDRHKSLLCIVLYVTGSKKKHTYIKYVPRNIF